MMYTRYNLRFFTLSLFLLPYTYQAATSWSRPEIQPKASYIMLEPNTNTTLFCQGKEPLTWTWPIRQKVPPWTEFNILRAAPKSQDYKYASTLEIINMSYPFVGFYDCHHKDDESANGSIYLYVNDREHLSVDESIIDIYWVYTIVHREALIPCRPTSPYVNVTLTHKNEIVSFNQLDQDNIIYHYNPMYGITTNDTKSIGRRDRYECNFNRNVPRREQTAYVHLFVEEPVDKINTPILSDLNEGHTVEGHELQLICAIITKNGVDIHWITPKGPVDTSRMTEEKKTIRNFEKVKYLTIHNASIGLDKGTYSCKATDKQNHSSSTSSYVNVFSAKENFINMPSVDDISPVVVPADKQFVELNISIEAHPQPTIKWFNNVNVTITDADKYEMSYDKTTNTTFLKIKNLTIEDMGNYTILASNGKKNVTRIIFLNVTDQPSVYIDTNQFHLINTPNIAKCIAIANPPPQFEWEYTYCDTDECDFVPISATTLYKSKDYEFISEAWISSKSISKSGKIKCSAKNSKGFDNITKIFYISDVKNGFDVFGLDSTVNFDENPMTPTVAYGDPIRVTCGASISHYSNITWFFNNKILDTRERYTISSSFTKFSRKLQLKITPTNFSDNGLYSCRVTGKNGKHLFKNISFIVANPRAPTIYKTNMKDNTLKINIPEELIMICKVEGIPKPTLTWFKDGVPFKPKDSDRIIISENNEKITFNYTMEEDEGSYKCEARNRIGVALKQQTIKFKNLPGKNPKWLIYVTIFLSLLFLVAIAFILIKIRKEKRLQQELEILGLKNFVKGAVQHINSDLGIEEQAELLPYDTKWEIPIEDIKIGKQLGSGAFGVVMKGEVKNIVEEEPITTVAIKMVRKNADSTYIRALASELKIMVHLGKHLNIVNLLGACTKNVAKRELLVIVEYCRFGNLQNYLLRHKEAFIDQVDMNTGEVNFSLGQGFLNRSYSMSSDKSIAQSPKIKYAALKFPEGSISPPNCNTKAQAGAITIPEVSPSMKYASLNFYSSNDAILPPANSSGVYQENGATQTGASEGEGVILSNNSEQPCWRSNYKGDYRGNVKPICTKDLLVWAFQVARGMEYLASRKILHGDLAARNILLADNDIVKICDFGLAKSMYKNDNYKKQGKGPLPFKWMAIESIGDRIFSTQSDVWSFGIVLWEFFSLGTTPYPGREANEKLYKQLQDGLRMESPPYAPKEIYNMMTRCWAEKPSHRPSFTKLSEEIGYLIDEASREYFIELNDPYHKTNIQRLESGENDYLAMVHTPTFETLPSPHYVNENVGQDGFTGYLTMSPNNSKIEEVKVFNFNVKRPEDGNKKEALAMKPLANDSITPVTPNSVSNPIYGIPPTIMEETCVDDV